MACCLAEGIERLSDAPRSGAPPKPTADHREHLLHVARCRPWPLGLPFFLRTAARFVDHLAELTGVRPSPPRISALLRRRDAAEPAAAHDRQPRSRVCAEEGAVETARSNLKLGEAFYVVLLYLPTHSPWLNSVEMLWRHYRREVTHGELFESIDALLGATRETCDRCNQAPKRTRSVISAHSA